MEADQPLQSRNSEEYGRARSLIQNAMDAIRNLSHLTQYFSQLVIPLGDEPPRNLNIIQNSTGPRLSMANYIIPQCKLNTLSLVFMITSLVNESNGANGPLGPGLIALAPSILSQENGEQVVVRGNGPAARNSQSSGTPPASSARDRGLFDLAFFTSTVTGAPNQTSNGQESGKLRNYFFKLKKCRSEQQYNGQ